MADVSPTLAQARRLRALGLSVFRIPYGSKIPDSPWKEFQSRFATDPELVEWFAGPPMNIGVATGRLSGVVMIDADTAPAVRYIVRRIPYTPWQTKTSRGFHFWFAHP